MGAVHVAILAMAVAFAPASEAFAPASSAILRRAAPGPSIAQLPLRHAALSARRGCSLRMKETEEKKDVAETPAEEPVEENMMTKVKAAGVAGLVSYALWEFVFWIVSVPLAIFTYKETTGVWPNFDDNESKAKVSAVIFGFLNLARALVPVRIGLTLATTPLVDKYIIKPFGFDKKKEGEEAEAPKEPPTDTTP
mmetsp:Transcript_20479/g.49582  ORF Transcript_20479/g.49582 Transcript_20479/m.49582 type:complete len:195 (+) Transcript_20479:84-668(+)|eukprot:CAMPEP_0180141788 /NCGR_PEP_ID=MMETSP0986-20121125/15150_1 /TAXON_ID=697907 /ORGANISM="non described non described, Strain CCMP2293" /LENGTH=194 /DNA_ID=CAMNT_0022084775 /DNA_START=83 /DNA_END=667 /DNA_ORIENTATION=-